MTLLSIIKMNVKLIYSAEDASVANRIRNELVHKQIHVNSIENNIKPGDLFIETLVTSIKESQIFLFLISKNSVKSEVFSSEIAITLSEWRNDSTKKIIPIILDHEAKIPPFLNQFIWLDLSVRSFDESLDLLIKSIESDSSRTLSDDELKQHYENYIQTSKGLLNQEKNEYKSESQAKFKKFLFYFIIYVYILIGFFTLFFFTNIFPLRIFNNDLFPFLVGLIIGVLTMFVIKIYYDKKKEGENK